MPKILSVIIPCYNVAQYLADCLDSVLFQDVDNSTFEVIVVDDCSPCGEKEIVDTYLSRYDNVRYVRHDVNKRQGGARNTGIRAAQGEYVMFLDADDCIKYQNTFSILIESVKKYQSVVLRSTSLETFSSDCTYQQIRSTYVNEVSCQSLDFIQWRKSSLFNCSSCATLYKRNFLLENNLFFRENVLFEDTDWVQKTMYYAGSIEFIDFAYYAYRQSPNSTTRGYSIEAFEGNVDGVVEMVRFYSEREFVDSFLEYLNEGFVNNVIGLLRLSRKYKIKESCRIIKKLNVSGLTQLRSKKVSKNFILLSLRYLPSFTVIGIKFCVSIKEMCLKFKNAV